MPQNKIIPELHVTNYQASLDFYTQVLGFDVSYAREEEGFAFLEREGAELMIDFLDKGRSFVTGEMEHPFGRGMNLQIEASDVDFLYQQAKKHEAPIFIEMEEKWYRREQEELGNRQFIVQDPDGYLLRFFQSLGSRPFRL